MNRKLALLSFVLAGAGACAVPAADDTDAASSAYAVQLPAGAAASVLDLVNYPGTDADVLDRLVGLDSRAAAGIVAARNGADGVAPSGDDVYFADLAAVDAVPYVGDTAFQKLQSYAQAHPAPAAETVKGVSFHGWESEAVVWGVNHADLAALDALIDTRAAQGLLAKRPFTGVTQMGAVSYVGATALGQLRGGAAAWWHAMRGAPGLGGTFDAVSFDDATAEVALAIANQATPAQLTAHGVTGAAAGHIVGGRPYATLAQLAAVSGVGTATMAAVHGYARSGQWGAPADCVAQFDDAVGPHLADLLFLSESDRPFDLVAYPGAGGSAPTAASVLALVGGEAGSTAESRAVDNFYVGFEPNTSTSDPNAASIVEAAVAAQLTDVVYIAVHPPDTSIDRAVVNVYLLGRTACGDLVGLHSIAIET